MNRATPAADLTISPRIVLDYQIEALAAIILRHLGDGYIAPIQPKICEGWVADFQRTYDNPQTRPIQTLFRADPMKGKNFDAVKEGEASWPLFAIWRSKNVRRPHTAGVDKNTMTVKFMWVLPPHSETERIWPLLQQFDEHLRRVLTNTFRCVDDRRLLDAALLRDFALGWQAYETEMGYMGPSQQMIYPCLAGSFQAEQFWPRTVDNLGMDLPAFHHAYFEYLLRHRLESGSIDDARLNPELASRSGLVPPDRGAINT
ncbi:MAG: hypothetical protein BWZ07_02710 [Alphaproteobacteria bacterium ADurb.BinA280]|nr:MAG: hypothetical protein BWZ07_02710 [Alphaproteobacteria bacterium ADurb.BinA280]